MAALSWNMVESLSAKLVVIPALPLLFAVNPIPHGRALQVPLLNPAQVIEGDPARLGNPILLDLDGFGIRGMTWARARYLIIAGSYDGTGPSWLYEWDGLAASSPRRRTDVAFAGLNPEGLDSFVEGETEMIFIVSDDGAIKIRRSPFRGVKRQQLKSFRTVTIIR
jgi:hypothetical protein